MEETKTEESDKPLPRCQNKEAGCNHYEGSHAKGAGRCFAGEYKNAAKTVWIPCKCKGLKRIRL
jgi:hypothetical protein